MSLCSFLPLFYIPCFLGNLNCCSSLTCCLGALYPILHCDFSNCPPLPKCHQMSLFSCICNLSLPIGVSFLMFINTLFSYVLTTKIKNKETTTMKNFPRHVMILSGFFDVQTPCESRLCFQILSFHWIMLSSPNSLEKPLSWRLPAASYHQMQWQFLDSHVNWLYVKPGTVGHPLSIPLSSCPRGILQTPPRPSATQRLVFLKVLCRDLLFIRRHFFSGSSQVDPNLHTSMLMASKSQFLALISPLVTENCWKILPVGMHPRSLNSTLPTSNLLSWLCFLPKLALFPTFLIFVNYIPLKAGQAEPF